MKTRWGLVPLLSVVLFAGCASTRNSLVLAPVGPAPAITAGSALAGTLVVFSAFERNAPLPPSPDYRKRYSNYSILGADGRLIQQVSNDTGAAVGMPVEVKLAPGAYRVVAPANGYGVVTVPVVIAANRTTTVHLEGGTIRSVDLAGAAAVRLPDGQVVGWRAQDSAGL
jgi:hypothetical protein